MRRLLFTALLALFTVAAAVADSQADFNRCIRQYNSALAAASWTPAAKAALEAAGICAEAKNYDGAFKLLSGLDRAMADKGVTADSLPTPYYYTAKGRFDLYEHMSNNAQAEQWLRKMGTYAKKTGSKEIASDMLFTEAQFYYGIGKNQQGDQCIARLIKQFETSDDYSAADKAYKQLISKAVSTDDAVLVERTYEQYMRWSDSIEAINAHSELAEVKQEMAATEAASEKKDHTITARTSLMTVFILLFVCSLVMLGLGAMFYMRVLRRKRSMESHVRQAQEMIAAKNVQLQNMADSIEPALEQLPQDNPAVNDIRTYVKRVEEFSEVESSPIAPDCEHPAVNLEQFCDSLAAEFRPLLKRGATIHIDGAKGMARFNAEEVRRILEHLLDNAVKFTPEGGKVTLTYRKRSATTSQFIVADNGPGIPDDEKETLFKAFNSSRDISEGDGLGLPICALRAEKIGGSLTLDPTVTRGTAFILTLH